MPVHKPSNSTIKSHLLLVSVLAGTSINLVTCPPNSGGIDRSSPDLGDAVDENAESDTMMNNGRELKPRATLETMGFQLEYWPME